MVEKERPPSNYSSSDETKREQRREFNNGHPQWNQLSISRELQNELSDMREASASMHDAPLSLCLMHDCADARWQAGGGRVVVRVTRRVISLAPIRHADFLSRSAYRRPAA